MEANKTSKQQNTMNEKLESIATKAGADLMALVKDGETHILEAWAACEAEAKETDTKPRFKLGLAVTLDLEKCEMESALTFGVKHKLVINGKMPDPNQGELGIKDGGSVTIKTGDKVVGPMPLKTFSRAVKRITKKQKA